MDATEYDKQAKINEHFKKMDAIKIKKILESYMDKVLEEDGTFSIIPYISASKFIDIVNDIQAYANQSKPDVSDIIGIIESAKCPNSRCVDGVIDEIPDGEISQCQWCYEAEKILIKLQSKPDVSDEVDWDSLTEEQQEHFVNRATSLLKGLYHCTRVWDAWNVGTMTQDDFIEVDNNEAIINDTAKELFEANQSKPKQEKQSIPEMLKDNPTYWREMYENLKYHYESIEAEKPDVSDDEATVCDNSCPHWGYQCNINEKFKECTKSRKSKLTPK